MEVLYIATVYIYTSDTLKCREFLAQLGSVRVRMRNLRPCDNRETPLRLNLREAVSREIITDLDSINALIERHI